MNKAKGRTAKTSPLQEGTYEDNPENINEEFARLLFKSWFAFAEIIAFKTMIVYLLASLIAAFFIGFLRLPGGAIHRINFSLQLVLYISLGLLFFRLRHLLNSKKTRTSLALDIDLPKHLKYLKYIREVEMPELFKQLSRSKRLQILVEALKDEFPFWNDRLKNSSAIILAAGVFLGIQYRTDTWFLDIVGIITSWAFLVGLQMGGVTQRALRYLKAQQLKLELEES